MLQIVATMFALYVNAIKYLSRLGTIIIEIVGRVYVTTESGKEEDATPSCLVVSASVGADRVTSSSSSHTIMWSYVSFIAGTFEHSVNSEIWRLLYEYIRLWFISLSYCGTLEGVCASEYIYKGFFCWSSTFRRLENNF